MDDVDSNPKLFLFLQLLFPTLTHAMHSKMKINKLIRFSLFSFLFALIACNSTDSSSTDLSTDAEITSFKLAENDSVAASLSLVHFTIDQNKNLIYNADSLPVGTSLTTKLLATISFASASKATIYYLNGDTLSYSSTDSIKFSSPFHIKVIAYDGVTSKTYEVKLNVHQQVPDSLDWQMVNSSAWNFSYNSSKTVAFQDKFFTYFDAGTGFSLWSSAQGDGIQWNSESLSGFPANADINSITAFNGVLYITTSSQQLYKSTDGKSWEQTAISETGFVAILGAINGPTGDSRLMVEKAVGDKYYLAYTTDGNSFTNCRDITASDEQEVFPVRDFAVITSPSSKSNKLTVIGGVDSNNTLLYYVYQMYWDSYNNLQYAANINNYYSYAKYYKGFSARKGAMAFYYDDKMVVAGGQGSSSYNNDMYTSIDHGISWQKQDSMINLPKTFVARANASTYVDANDFVWVFGGNNQSGLVKEIWRGRINRFGFLNK